MNETIKDRTKKFIEHKNITVSRFEELCDLSNGYISSMRKGYGREKLENVLKAFPELSRNWLLFGEGEMLNVCGDRNIVGNSAGRDLNIAQWDREEGKERDDMSIDAFARRLLDMQENLQKQLVALGEAVNSKDEQINKLLSIIDKLTDKQ